MTQKERILQLLRQRGPEGVNTTDVLGPAVMDGGPPILRTAARIRELQQAGHRITSRRLMNGTSTYFLHDGPVGVSGPGCGPGRSSGSRGVASPTESPPEVTGHDAVEGNRADVLFELEPVNATLGDWDS